MFHQGRTNRRTSSPLILVLISTRKTCMSSTYDQNSNWKLDLNFFFFLKEIWAWKRIKFVSIPYINNPNFREIEVEFSNHTCFVCYSHFTIPSRHVDAHRLCLSKWTVRFGCQSPMSLVSHDSFDVSTTCTRSFLFKYPKSFLIGSLSLFLLGFGHIRDRDFLW